MGPVKQKNYSLPKELLEWLDQFFEENKTILEKIGIRNKSQLVAATVNNGIPEINRIVEAIKNMQKE